jgi:hypothetical protein
MITAPLLLSLLLSAPAAPSAPPPVTDATCAPHDGATGVPTNVVFVVDADVTFTATLSPAAGAAPTVTGDYLFYVDPGALQPNTAYSLELDDGAATKTVAFETGAGDDTTAPSTPSGVTAEERVIADGPLAGTNETTVRFDVASDDYGVAHYWIDSIDLDSGEERGAFLEFHPTDGSSSVEIYDAAAQIADVEPRAERVEYVFTAVDWAGNESEPSPPFEVVLSAQPPLEDPLCACARAPRSTAAWSLVAVAPLALLLRRRRAWPDAR